MDDVSITIAGPDTVVICRGDTVELTQTNTAMDAGLEWRPAEGFLSATDEPIARIVPIVSRYYVVRVDDGESVAEDSVYVDVKQLVVPVLVNDTTICENSSLQLAAMPITDVRQTTYDWSPGVFLEDSTDVNVLYMPTSGGDTVFTLIATSADSVCADTQSVRVNVIRSDITVIPEDTAFVCDTQDTLTLSASGVDGPITWFPTTGILDSATGPTISVQVLDDITYFATAEINGCPQIDSVAVRVDSLPFDLTITAEPEKDPYCVGDTVTLISPVFDAGDFRLITHEWIESPGSETPEELFNLIFIASDTADYTRVTTNGACVDTTIIPINVVRPPTLIFDPPNPIVCPGESLEVTVSFDSSGIEGTLEWMDPAGGTLSCTDCLDPTITTESSITYEIEVTSVPGDCPSMETYTVLTAEDALPVLIEDTRICAGESIDLVAGGIRDDYTYMLSGGGEMRMGTDFEVSPSETTTYTITSDGNCGAQEQEITIEVLPAYTLTLDAPDVVCRGSEVTFTAVVEPERNGVLTFSPAGGVTDGNTYTIAEVSDDLTVTASFVDEEGCQNQEASATVGVQDQEFTPIVVARRTDGVPLSDSAAIIAGGSVILEVSNVPSGFSGSFSWEGNGNPATATGTSIQVEVPESGVTNLSYFVMITSDAGCDAVANISLPVTELPFAIPEVISANRDGTNDNFQVFFQESVAVDEFDLIVYNRWGQEVFSSSDPAEGWDGTKNGSPQNLGTYLYLTRFIVGGVPFEREGQFALVR